MSAVSQAQECSSVITLKGSTQIVSEFFRKTRSDGVGESWFINTQCVLEFSINNILYQRGIYPPESFDDIKQYGLKMVTTNDPDLKTYLETVLSQMTEWLREGFLQQIVLVVTGEEDKAVLERWVFNIETDKEVMLNKETTKTKSMKDITREIQAIIKQITSSVTYLPLLDQPCSFDLLMYTDSEAQVPRSWEETDPKYITDSESVRLRSFTTKVHKVDAMVSYRLTLDDEEEDA